MKHLLIFATAFAVFFMSGVMAQEVPAEKQAPACKTISEFFPDHIEYILREHVQFVGVKFAFVAKDKNIVVFQMNGPCIGGGKGFVVRRYNPYFDQLYAMIFAGDDA